MVTLDYQNNHYTDDLYTETNISELDVLPLPYLFRSFDAMPPLEQLALKTADGKILDVGCGAGSHSLYLQELGNEVTGIDISVGAIEVCKLRGLTKVKAIDILQLNEEKFDSCIKNVKYIEEVQKDLNEGRTYGVTGTPGFFIGNEKIGFVELKGAQPFESFKKVINSQLEN